MLTFKGGEYVPNQILVGLTAGKKYELHKEVRNLSGRIVHKHWIKNDFGKKIVLSDNAIKRFFE